MGTMLLAATIAALGSLAPQDGPADGAPAEVVQEFWAPGRLRWTAEVVAGGDGGPVRQGAYREWHENGELAVEGEFAGGERHGAWSTFHANGKRATRARYRRGALHGTWRSWHANGEKSATGKYQNGWRSGNWDVWTFDGDRDEEQSGTYDTVAARYDGRRERWRCETRGGVWHGRFRSWWEDGSPQADGGYAEGLPEGEWRFWHPDGTFDPGYVSGDWIRGTRMGDAEPSSEEVPRAVLPPLAPDHLGARRVRGELRRFLESERPATDGGDAAPAELRLARADLPAAIDLLASFDPDDAGEARLAGHLERAVLAPTAGGYAYGWRDGTAVDDVAHNGLVQRRWHSLWQMTRDDLGYWAFELGAGLGARWSRSGENPLTAPPLVRRTLDDPFYAPRFGPGPAPESDRQRERGPALRRALAWLAESQAPDGHWSGADHGGLENMDVGLTGLALLAFLADGHTLDRGEFAETVARGAGWLAAQVDPTTGLVPKSSMEFLYGQAIATWALCEVSTFSEHRVLRRVAQRMVDAVQRARNPSGAWRYDTPPDGSSDSSVTSWMLLALDAARRAGLEVDPAAARHGVAFLAEMTDPVTGRVGYDAVGSLSARTVLNEDVPREVGEAMTAAALLCRIVSGEDREGAPVLGKYADRILATPPLWSDEGYHDLYYWHWATAALWQVGGGAWERWELTLLDEVLPHQVADGALAGSWEPLGAWGYAGGRVYSTSLLALCLAAPKRFARLGEPWR